MTCIQFIGMVLAICALVSTVALLNLGESLSALPSTLKLEMEELRRSIQLVKWPERPSAADGEGQLTRLRRANTARAKASYPQCEKWLLSQWGNALAGEVGEACNKIKKMERDLKEYKAGDTVSAEELMQHDEAVAAVASELADIITYADLIAAKLDINLWSAVVQKFNEVSKRVNSDVRLQV